MDTAKGLSESLKNAVSERENILAFLNANRLIKKEDIEKFRALSLKTGKTDAEKAELEKIKTSAVEAKKKFEDLQFKPSPNDADLKLLDDFRNRQTASQEIGEKIVRDFQKEIEQIKSDNEKSLFDSYKGSVAEVGKKQGFTIIFDANIAPFAANDATEEVVKAATKK
jgi:Skp family chaperone for outer membrane proteins